jgi:arylsulfatase A-like enzyme
MRIGPFSLVVMCCAAAAAAAPAADQIADPRPNIILILADDMGVGDLGCYGGTSAPTPRIDELAREGTRFTQYYSASPICSPSRAGHLTGQFPGRVSLTSYLQDRRGNRGCEQADFLDPDVPTLPRLLRVAGYATAHFGKWHLGGGRDVTDAPKFAAYGYDEHAGTYESPEPHPDITATNWIWSDTDKVKRWDRTAFFVDKTLDFMTRHKGQPCFVNLWLDDVHTPWVPGPNAPRRQSRRNLRRVLVELDRQMGRLIDGLEEVKLSDSTLVIFTSDNGPLPTFQGARTTGLRGSKLSLYEGGIRLPFIARWPGHVPAGRVDDQTVLSSVDMLPTLCALAGVGVPAASTLDGEDMSGPLLGTPRVRHKPLFWEYGRNDEHFAYPQNAQDCSPNLAVRDGRWKLLMQDDGSRRELYDLDADKHEAKNIAANQPVLVKRLSLALQTWRETLPSPSMPRQVPVE